MTKLQVREKTFDIELQNIQEMDTLIASPKHTIFVNQAIRKSLDEIKREKKKKEKQEVRDSLEQLYSMRVKFDESAVNLVREARHDRADWLVANIEENAN